MRTEPVYLENGTLNPMIEKGHKQVTYLLNLSRDEVERVEMDRIRAMFQHLHGVGKKAIGHIRLDIVGYPNEPHLSVYERPQVRQYLDLVQEEFPHMWYYLAPMENALVFNSLVALNVASHIFGNAVFQYDEISYHRQLEKMIIALKQYGAEIEDQKGAEVVAEMWKMSTGTRIE